MTRQMADDEVLRVLRAEQKRSDREGVARFDGAIAYVAALQAERDAANAYAERCTAANTQAERENDELRAALEALRGQVAGLVADAYAAGWVVCAQWARREDLVHDIGSGAYAEERDAALLAIKERMG